MPSDYNKIRDENIREYGQGTRHLSFWGRLYTDRTHFVFELLQNAEDAGASRILFRLFHDRLEVTHDGRPFNEIDVRGVCGVGEGTKAEDLTQIGKFGIGFKSVYAYTSTPEVHSGDESFRIENYVRPYPVEPRRAGDSWTTLFVFAFDAVGIDPETASREIGVCLRNLSARTLLFLRKINKIEYKLPDLTGVYLRQEVARGPARQVTVIGQNNGQDEDENWLIFERAVPVPDGSTQVRVEVGFRLETSTKDATESITKIKAPLIVYFPTEQPTMCGFLIQGPYRTTPSRATIPKDDDWNATLIRETAHLLTDVLPNLREIGLLTVSLLEALPIRMDDFTEDSMFYPIVVAVREALMNKDLLPADDETFVSARNAKLARGADLRKLLNQDQLRSLFQPMDAIKWLIGEITQDRTPDLRTYLLNELHVEEVTPDDFARKITQSFLTSQADDWFVEYYRYLSGQEALWRSPRWAGDTGGLLRTKPILRLQDDSQGAPFRPDGTTPNAFLPPPDETDFPIVKRTIVNNEQVGEFLKRLGLSEPDVFDDIVERVLPKYVSADVSSIHQHEHTADIQKILRAMASDSEAGKKKVVRAARQIPFLKAVDQSARVSFKNPSDVYADNPELRLYFASSDDVWFLDEQTVGLPPYGDAWSEFGVARLPRRMLFSEGLPPGEEEYSTRRKTIENYNLHGLEDFLESLQNIPDYGDQKKAALVLWRFLKEHLELIPRFFKGRYQWFYRSDHTKSFDSHMLTCLRYAKWIPTKNESMEKPSDLTADQLLDEYAGANELIDVLGIQQGTGQISLTEEEKRREHASELGVALEDIEFIKGHSEAFEQLKAAIAARNEKPIFPTRTVVNPERRQKVLDEQLKDSPEKNYEPRTRSVRVTEATEYTRVWLKEQYTNDKVQMVCQICEKEMPFKKRDGEYYFEAVEALSRDYFGKEHEAQFLALCPLCASMYREFVKLDESAMKDLNHALKNSEEPEVSLNLGELKTSIRFVESHWQNMRTILQEK